MTNDPKKREIMRRVRAERDRYREALREIEERTRPWEAVTAELLDAIRTLINGLAASALEGEEPKS